MNPAERLAAAAAAQWGEVSAAFTAGRQLVRVVGCEVQQLQLVLRSGRPKEVRKRVSDGRRWVAGSGDAVAWPCEAHRHSCLVSK